jgi:hypothetical protein
LSRPIQAEEKDIPVDGIKRYPIPSFEDDEVELKLRRPSGKPRANRTTFNGGIFPPFITQQEWQKFKDLVFPRNDQRIPGMINILAINTDSATHDMYALAKELEEDFMERVSQGNVTEQMKKLSGVLFIGAWERESRFWSNDAVAVCPIPTDVAKSLQEMIG